MIVDASDETIYLEEGCLSFPNLYVKIKRPRSIKVRYTEPNGNVVTQKFDGMTARVFQHELDHLNGVVHLSRAHPIHVDKAKTRAKKLNRIKK
jgi:peptide deformylase